MPHSNNFSSGFSLIEVLLSVTIISMLAGLSLPLYASFQNRNDLDITAQGIAEALRRAQVYARGVSGDSQWGVAIQSSGAVLFKGANFAARDSTYDETIPITNMTASGINELSFAKLSGAPNITGTIMITSSTNETRTITINAKGMVSY